MDPGGMMNEGPYNLAEIWQYPMNGGSESGMSRASFGPNLSHFGDGNRDGSANDPEDLDQRLAQAAAVIGVGTMKRRDLEDESAKVVPTSSVNGVNDGDGKRLKTSGCRDENCDMKAEAEPRKPLEKNTHPPEPPKDYIHVRARRGQATDSHSLAERARREKISERMKILQDLVPGCNKVIGKALVLDEIINYIQSLQRQVEFLSMKLEAVNTRMNPGIEVFPPKDFGQQAFESTGIAFSSQATREYSRGTSPEWLHMQVGSGFERT